MNWRYCIDGWKGNITEWWYRLFPSFYYSVRQMVFLVGRRGREGGGGEGGGGVGVLLWWWWWWW